MMLVGGGECIGTTSVYQGTFDSHNQMITFKYYNVGSEPLIVMG